ncbi:hypothetical protein ACFL0V_04630 [Nanoarchaeota archaeon]
MKNKILEHKQAKDLIKEAISHKKDKDIEYTTIKKKYKGNTVYIDIPSHIKEWNTKKYGYQLTLQKGIIYIRIIPKTKYSKHLLTNEELEKRLLLHNIPDIEMSEITQITENPFTILERQGRIVRLSEKAVRKNIHFVMSHYENPEESEDPDFILGDLME